MLQSSPLAALYVPGPSQIVCPDRASENAFFSVWKGCFEAPVSVSSPFVGSTNSSYTSGVVVLLVPFGSSGTMGFQLSPDSSPQPATSGVAKRAAARIASREPPNGCPVLRALLAPLHDLIVIVPNSLA